jgi:O-antigen/teichoic acid export membrane protein
VIEHSPTARDTLDRLRPRSLGHSALVSWLRWVVNVAVMALVFPLMLARMGAGDFGLWAALTAPTSLGAFFGLGVSPAVVSLLGRSLGLAFSGTASEASERLSEAGTCARAGLLFSLIAAMLAVGGGWALAATVVGVLHVPHAQAQAAVLLFRASSLCLGGMLLGAGLTAVLEAVGRLDLSAIANAGVTLANAGFLVVAVLVRPAFDTLAWVSVATAVTNVVAPLVLLMTSGTVVLFGWGSLDRQGVLRLTRLALSLGVVSAIGALIDPAIKWTVGAVGGGVPVAAYELASRVALVLTGSFAALVAPLTPYYARALTEYGREHVAQRVSSATRLLMGVELPTVTLFAAASAAVMHLWLGDHLPPGAVASVEILALSTAVSIALRTCWGAMVAAGQGTRLLVVQLGSVGCTAVILVLAAGNALPLTIAAAIAFAATSLIGSALTVVQYGRTFGRSAATSLLKAGLTGIVLAAVTAPAVLTMRLVDAGAGLQLATAALAWLMALVYLARYEPRMRSLLAQVLRRVRHSSGMAK